MGDEKVGGRVLHHTPLHSTVIGRFEQLVSGTAPRQHLPPALVKERKRQRGDDNEEAAAEEPKPKMTVFDRLERAAQLALQGKSLSFGR